MPLVFWLQRQKHLFHFRIHYDNDDNVSFFFFDDGNITEMGFSFTNIKQETHINILGVKFRGSLSIGPDIVDQVTVFIEYIYSAKTKRTVYF